MSTAGCPVAAYVARFLKARGVDRVFGLCGGHVMPLWMAIDAEGIGIIDVRDERAAVYMAHAYGELRGAFGVALVTAGPGVTNAITGIANAHVARAPVLVLSGAPARAQEGRGALQDLPHVEVVRPLTRYARTLREPSLVPASLDEAVSCALGEGGEPGPVYVDFPVDTLRADLPQAVELREHLIPRHPAQPAPDPASVRDAANLLWSARRPLVISGRGARRAKRPLVRLLDRLGGVYLDTGESRGLVPDDHPAVVAAVRGVAMTEADVVLTVGRRLDFQLAYGSPAVFGDARFVRIADTAGELRDNRRGEIGILAGCAQTLDAIVAAAGARTSAADSDWTRKLRQRHLERVERLEAGMRDAADDAQGRMHPNRLLAALSDRIGADAIVVADGGDLLSFARVGVRCATWLDPGSLGCIGIGTPFGIAATLAMPERTVCVVTGDGAFGFNAMEVDTAVRHRVPVLVVVANNGAWQIEVDDQQRRFGRVSGTRLQFAGYGAMARAFGMYAERVVRAADLPAAIDRALARRPALLDVVVSPDASSSDSRSGLARVPDLQALDAWDDAERRWRESRNQQRRSPDDLRAVPQSSPSGHS